VVWRGRTRTILPRRPRPMRRAPDSPSISTTSSVGPPHDEAEIEMTELQQILEAIDEAFDKLGSASSTNEPCLPKCGGLIKLCRERFPETTCDEVGRFSPIRQYRDRRGDDQYADAGGGGIGDWAAPAISAWEP